MINTGWVGGHAGEVDRVRLGHTRAMVRAALDGVLDGAETAADPYFGVEVPTRVPGVPPQILLPAESWGSAEAYRSAATRLAEMFRENFRSYEGEADPQVVAAGPRLAGPTG